VLEVVGTRELGFFGGTCRGAAFEGFVYDKEDGARAAGLKVLGLEGCEEEIKCYCNGGGVFVGAEEMEGKGVEVLARFTEKVKVEGGDVAAVYCKVGAGAAILTGVHPEYNPLKYVVDGRIRAAQLNKADGGPEFVKLIDELLAHDAGRSLFLRGILKKLGLKVSVENGTNGVNGHGIPTLTPIHISSSSESINRAIYKSLVTIADQPSSEQDNTFTITDTNDTFNIRRLSSSFDSMCELKQILLNGHHAHSNDPTPKTIYFHPSPTTYQNFSPKQYFSHLPSTSTIGQSLAYVYTTSSTQTLLDKNPALLRCLPSGFVIHATSQLNGRGRAGNAWISPRGALAFSFTLRLPIKLSPRLVFVQYLVSLAVVEGIRGYGEGWEDVNVGIKWPNDVYGKSRYAERWEKIGGIIVNSTYFENEYVLVIGNTSYKAHANWEGCGINTTNAHPTTSLLNIIPESLAPPTHERLLANILSTFSDMYTEFLQSGFQKFEKKYYERWLHEGQIVSIENGITRGKVMGISCADGGSGGLIVDEVDLQGRSMGRRVVEVIADGNSFDMMKGLLRRKR